jgi:hypothetical protein
LLRQAVSYSAANLSFLLLLTSTDIDPVLFRADFAELTYFKHLTFGNKERSNSNENKTGAIRACQFHCAFFT